MNVYDFDNTIYRGDSTLDFYFFCLKKKPMIITICPRQIKAAMLYKMRRIDKTSFKQEFYSFLNMLNDIDGLVREFWDINDRKIKNWYLLAQKDDDVIISASPYFLLDEICRRLNINRLIASNVDKYSGKYTGANCYGKEKVKRFIEIYNQEIDNFYSDSRSDLPMAHMAKNRYIVKGYSIRPWL